MAQDTPIRLQNLLKPINRNRTHILFHLWKYLRTHMYETHLGAINFLTLQVYTNFQVVKPGRTQM